ncbi:MAG TPA: XrtA-associated tyrosine autokinase [Casimicrobiaceae bacterium]|nr:XrtA-associated tyrosine autokinase [Casimicrobiaceae bacterium]
MSLIEQAAKRLEELRRAGADIGGDAVVDAPRHASTPEAVVRALDAQSAAHFAAAARASRSSDGTHARQSAPPTPSDAATRRVDLDLPLLNTRGFITPESAKSQIADEFRVLKRPLIRNALGKARVRNGNLVMVTSALPGEGKTFTSVNLALSIAMEIDSTVLLVDGDVAHPSIPALLGVPHGPGLLDLLTRDDINFTDAMIRTNVDKLAVLPAGSRHRRSTELLASEQMANLLRELASRYSDRVIIFDSPPLLATTEARVLATHMGQIVMVVAADATSQHAVGQALATIESCDVVLMALNKARRTDVGTYYGYYGDDRSP